MKKVLIIGGGASGLMAAIAAAEQGAKVTLLEKNKQTGKKLLVTGNGRCNFTNKDQKLEHYRSEAPEFVREALSQFSMGDTVRFFEKLGIRVKDRNGYLYPASGQAASIAEVLRLEALRQGVKLACNTEVLEVHKKDGQFQVVTEGWTYEGDALILACGSKAAPETGTVGDGYRKFRPLCCNTASCFDRTLRVRERLRKTDRGTFRCKSDTYRGTRTCCI